MQAPAVGASGGRWSRRPAAQMDAAAQVKRHRLIFGAAVVITLLGSFFGIFRSQKAQIDETRVQAEAAEALVVALNAELAHLRVLEKGATELREQARVMAEALPNQTDLAKYILQVQDVATKSGLDWISTNPTPPVPSIGSSTGLQEVLIAMGAEGDYFAVQRFISSLETLDRAVKIASVGITSKTDPSKPGGAPKLTADLDLKMFVAGAQVPAPAVPPGAQPAPSNPVPAPVRAPAQAPAA
ncbi:MAG: type 4a pilus biogenesis protein PilO [Actinomycetota bacterium]